jgi:type IV pilus assembly protein PilC
MAEFICRLGTPSGEIITKIIEANAANDARVKFESDGFRVFAVTSQNGGVSSVLPFLGGNKRPKVKQNDFLLFNQQLSALLRAGIPILQSIGLLKTRAQSAALREVLTDVESKIKSGIPLSEAFESQGIFPKIYTASLLAGERSGALDDVLERYVNFLRRSVGLGRKIKGAIAYPIFLLTAAIIMVGFLTIYVVPRMSDLFKGLSGGKGLPTVTVVVLAISNAAANNVWWFLPLIIIGGFALYIWLRTPVGKMILDKLLLKIPLGGLLIRQMTTSQLTRSMATLIAGGITVPDSWQIASQSITNLELRRRCQSVLPMIREGQGFTVALEKANWLPPLALDMVGIGEKSGSLREMLDEVANFYDAEAEVRLEQLTTLLEPIILVFMALIVVAILMAIYMPILQSISNGPFGGRK